jgi:hypothetical protein
MSSARDFASPFASARKLLGEFRTAQEPALSAAPVSSEELLMQPSAPVLRSSRAGIGDVGLDNVGVYGVGGGLSADQERSSSSMMQFSMVDAGEVSVATSGAPSGASSDVGLRGLVSSAKRVGGLLGGASSVPAPVGGAMTSDGGFRGRTSSVLQREAQPGGLMATSSARAPGGASMTSEVDFRGRTSSVFQREVNPGAGAPTGTSQFSVVGTGGLSGLSGSPADPAPGVGFRGFASAQDRVSADSGGGATAGAGGLFGSSAARVGAATMSGVSFRGSVPSAQPRADERSGNGEAVGLLGGRGDANADRARGLTVDVGTTHANASEFAFASNRHAFGAANNVEPSTGSSLGSVTTLSGSLNSTPSRASGAMSRLPSLFGAATLGSSGGSRGAPAPAPFMSARAAQTQQGGTAVFKGFGLKASPPAAASLEQLRGKDDLSGKQLNGGDDTVWKSDNKDSTRVESKGENNSSVTTRLCLLELNGDDRHCRGVIGSSGRICTVPRGQCSKASHKAVNPFLEQLFSQGVEYCLVIQSPSSKSASVSTSAYEAPYIDATLFNSSQVEELLSQEKTVAEWTALIPVINEIAIPEAAGRGGDPDNFEERAMRANTPAKRLPITTEKSFSPMDLLLGDLPSPSSDKFSEAVGKGFDTVGAAVNSLNSDVAELKNTAIDHLQAFNCLVDRLNNIQTSVGPHPKTATLPTLWMAVSELASSQEALTSDVGHQLQLHVKELLSLGNDFTQLAEQVKQTQSGEVTFKDLRTFEQRMGVELQTIEPFVLAQLHQSEKRTEAVMNGMLQGIEDLLIRMQQFFSNELPQLQSMLAMQGGSLNMVSGSNLSGLDEVRLAIDKLTASQAEQSARIREVEARTEDRIVVIDDFKFASLQSVQAFCSANKCAGNVFRFVCSISLLEMVTAMAQTYQSAIDDEHKGGQVGMAMPSDQKGHFSLKLDGPTALVGKPEVARENPRKLNPIKTYAAFFGSGSSDTGTRNTLMTLLRDKLPSFANEIQYAEIGGEAKMLARGLLMNSKLFIESSFQFMSTQMLEYAANTSLSEERRWDLCQAMMRILWSLVSECLKPVSEIPISAATTEDRAPEILWALLQANRVQQEIMQEGFKGHSAVAPLLTGFLLDIVAFSDDLVKLKKVAENAAKEANEAKRVADKAGIDARKALSTGGNKKQKKDGD